MTGPSPTAPNITKSSIQSRPRQSQLKKGWTAPSICCIRVPAFTSKKSRFGPNPNFNPSSLPGLPSGGLCLQHTPGKHNPVYPERRPLFPINQPDIPILVKTGHFYFGCTHPQSASCKNSRFMFSYKSLPSIMLWVGAIVACLLSL